MRHHRRATRVLVTVGALVASRATAQAGEIRGRILVAEKPASGITVSAVPFEEPEAEARRLARGGEAPRPVAVAATRNDGTFALALPATVAGEFRVLAEGPAVVTAWVGGTFDASESDDVGEHALARAETLAGRVVSATGAPVAGAAVTILPHASPIGADAEVVPAARTVTTGPDGVFRFAQAAADANRLTLIAKSYGATTLASVRAGAMPRPIALGLGALASGMVMRADRKTPAAGALVRFEGDGLETPWTEAGPDGRFRLADLPPRAGTVVAEGGEAGLGETASGPLPLAPGRTLTIVLAPPPTLEGLVLDSRTRTAVPRARVTVDDGTRTRTARAGPDGRYRIRGLLPQRAYRLRADEPRYTPYARDRVLLATAETLRLDVPLTLAASLAGRVVDEAGKPVAGALGRLLPTTTGGGLGRLRALRSADRLVFRTAADGTFKATRLTAGDEQRLTIVHPDYEAKTTGGLSLPPGSTKTVNVTLRRGLSLAGRVRDETGRPVVGAEVEAGSGSGMAARAARMFGVTALATARPKATTGGDGRFELKGLSEGTYALTVSKEGFADHRLDRVPVDAERRDALEITLSAGAAIRGLVARKDGRGAEGYWVRAVSPDSSGPGFGPGPMGLFGAAGEVRATGADGSFEIGGLRSGDTYDLVVLGPDGVGARREGVNAPTDDVEITVPGPGRIAGRVVDAQTSAPIPDFQVDFGPDRSSGRGGFGPGRAGGSRTITRALRAAAGEATGAQPVHSEDGAFALEDVPAGTWEVVAQAKGYQTAHVGGVSVEEGGTREGVEVRLTPGNAIRGRVLDGGSGAPVLDASVTLQRGGAGGRALALLQGESDARTDADGRFVIEGLAAGSYTVVAQHPDYANGTGLVEVKDGPASTELRLMPGGTLGGAVLSETSTPVAGAAVTLVDGAGGGGFGGFGRGGPAGGGFGGGQSTVTDESGRFRFLHVTAGRYSVEASLRGRQTAPVDVILQTGESRQNLTLSLAGGTRIRGIVSGLPAALRANVRVSASGADGYAAATVAAADGTFDIAGVPAGPVSLRATAGEFGGAMRTAAAQVSVAEGQEEAQAQIVFESGFALSGTVTRAGAPLAGAMVSAGLAGGGTSASGRTDASGAYRVEGLTEGEYNVMVIPGEGAPGAPRRQTVTVSGDTTLDVVIPSARVAGAVVESGTRQPVADALVQATGAEPGRGRTATSDSNGRFSLEDLDPSPYSLTVRKTGYQLATREITPAEGGGDDVVVELARGAGIGLEVHDASFGVPLHAVQVRATDGGGAPAFAGGVALDGDGRGEIPSLPPGAYTLSVYASGYAPAVLTATAPVPRLAVALTVGGAVEIHAGPATLAHGNARAQILGAGGQPYAFAFFAADGRLALSAPVRRIENLGPGTYSLQVESGESRPFEVQAGNVVVVTLP